MDWKRIRTVLLGAFFSLIAYPTLIFLLWLNGKSIDLLVILADGGLYFFATASSAPIFFETLFARRQPGGLRAGPFYALPLLIITLTMLVYATTVADSLGGTVLTPGKQAKVVYVGATCALSALAYRYGFDPEWSL